jgi:hypothetical protein
MYVVRRWVGTATVVPVPLNLGRWMRLDSEQITTGTVAAEVRPHTPLPNVAGAGTRAPQGVGLRQYYDKVARQGSDPLRCRRLAKNLSAMFY